MKFAIRIFLLLVVLFSMSAAVSCTCGDDDDDDDDTGDDDIAEEYKPLFLKNCLIDEEETFVIRTQAQWDDFAGNNIKEMDFDVDFEFDYGAEGMCECMVNVGIFSVVPASTLPSRFFTPDDL